MSRERRDAEVRRGRQALHQARETLARLERAQDDAQRELGRVVESGFFGDSVDPAELARVERRLAALTTEVTRVRAAVAGLAGRY